MGIRSLNRFLRQRCKNLLPQTIANMKGWTIAIDTNNYLYQIIDGDLMKNFDNFCCVLKKYDITPLFIFDGPPPEYKKKIIKQRRIDLSALRNKYNILEQISKDNNSSILKNSIHNISKKIYKLTSKDILSVKQYLERKNYKYLVTSEKTEADTVCYELINNNSVNAVLSEDMDIIGMGASVTIRNFNYKNETCIYYVMEDIINDIGITLKMFKQMCSMVSYRVSIEKAFEFINK
jgi:hypothetical protein